MAPLDYSTIKRDYELNGYVIIPGNSPLSLVPSLELFNDLRDACERTINKARSGQWTRCRRVGRPFPPYDNCNPDIWGVQDLMDPKLEEKIFAQWYCSERVLDAVASLLSCNAGDLELELFNLLINPTDSKFALRWHRDDIHERASEEEEVEALAKWHTGVQWNTALYRDESLFIVPGSHAKPRTPEQRALSSTMIPPTNPLDMPGAIQVVLQLGDTVFYNSNILHCAKYEPDVKRVTLHACIGDAARGGQVRARNVLQHDLRWMEDPLFRDSLPNDAARAMLDRILALQRMQGDEVVYSLTNVQEV